jgi:hypothetical protein
MLRRSIAEMRSSPRRSAGRGTAVERETVVDSSAESISDSDGSAAFLRINDVNMFSNAPRQAREFASKWDFMDRLVKRAFLDVEMNCRCVLGGGGEKN